MQYEYDMPASTSDLSSYFYVDPIADTLPTFLDTCPDQSTYPTDARDVLIVGFVQPDGVDSTDTQSEARPST